MDDLISRTEALEALDECPYNWNDWPEEIQAVNDWESHKEAIENIPAVDAAPVVRCAYCKHCYDMGNDPMVPYDGESEWYCARFDRDTSAYEIDPYRFFCADGERRDSE